MTYSPPLDHDPSVAWTLPIQQGLMGPHKTRVLLRGLSRDELLRLRATAVSESDTETVGKIDQYLITPWWPGLDEFAVRTTEVAGPAQDADDYVALMDAVFRAGAEYGFPVWANPRELAWSIRGDVSPQAAPGDYARAFARHIARQMQSDLYTAHPRWSAEFLLQIGMEATGFASLADYRAFGAVEPSKWRPIPTSAVRPGMWLHAATGWPLVWGAVRNPRQGDPFGRDRPYGGGLRRVIRVEGKGSDLRIVFVGELACEGARDLGRTWDRCPEQ
jgi:hypothetical protein